MSPIGYQGSSMCERCGKPFPLLTGLNHCECKVADTVEELDMGLLVCKPVHHHSLRLDSPELYRNDQRDWTDKEVARMVELNELQRLQDAKVWNNAGLVGYLVWLYRKFRWAMINSKYFNNIGKDFR